MNIKAFLFHLVFFCFITAVLQAQNPAIDIKKYDFQIELNDTTEVITARAAIGFSFKKTTDSLGLDLISKTADGKGMQVDSIKSEGKLLKFKQNAEKLMIAVTSDSSEINIYYHGVPKDGLIISKNKYGDRTFFGDNWPNRAHHWLPVVDHPSDKAFVDFTVTAPSYYQVVANGSLKEKTDLENNRMMYHYGSSVPLPTKVMVIGVARFAVEYLEDVNNIPLSSWVYPENKKEGFRDYAIAKDILDYFIKSIGPYPYAKLANVQSTTRYGGMENASNIFYFENSVTQKESPEFLMAHEIAHQWFGDSASETDWPQLYLSEGFATYFTDLYAEHAYGKKKLDEKLKEERKKVIDFSKKVKTPVIDTTRTDYTDLLNPNSYQKGAWFLHMLRRKTGDKAFWEAIRQYYQEYKLSNVSTDDLREVFEEVTGKNLKNFFQQWLKQYGQPVLKTDWKYHHKTLTFKVKQTQKNDFSFPLEVRFKFKDGSSQTAIFQIDKKQEEFKLNLDQKPTGIELDPETNLLFEH